MKILSALMLGVALVATPTVAMADAVALAITDPNVEDGPVAFGIAKGPTYVLALESAIKKCVRRARGEPCFQDPGSDIHARCVYAVVVRFPSGSDSVFSAGDKATILKNAAFNRVELVSPMEGVCR